VNDEGGVSPGPQVLGSIAIVVRWVPDVNASVPGTAGSAQWSPLQRSPNTGGRRLGTNVAVWVAVNGLLSMSTYEPPELGVAEMVSVTATLQLWARLAGSTVTMKNNVPAAPCSSTAPRRKPQPTTGGTAAPAFCVVTATIGIDTPNAMQTTRSERRTREEEVRMSHPNPARTAGARRLTRG